MTPCLLLIIRVESGKTTVSYVREYLRRLDQPACSLKSGGRGDSKMAAKLWGLTNLGLKHHITELVLAALWLGQISSRLRLIFYIRARGAFMVTHMFQRPWGTQLLVFSAHITDDVDAKAAGWFSIICLEPKAPVTLITSDWRSRGGGESREMH